MTDPDYFKMPGLLAEILVSNGKVHAATSETLSALHKWLDAIEERITRLEHEVQGIEGSQFNHFVYHEEERYGEGS